MRERLRLDRLKKVGLLTLSAVLFELTPLPVQTPELFIMMDRAPLPTRPCFFKVYSSLDDSAFNSSYLGFHACFHDIHSVRNPGGKQSEGLGSGYGGWDLRELPCVAC